jgi:hypothetical protein
MYALNREISQATNKGTARLTKYGIENGEILD